MTDGGRQIMHERELQLAATRQRFRDRVRADTRERPMKRKRCRHKWADMPAGLSLVADWCAKCGTLKWQEFNYTTRVYHYRYMRPESAR